MNVVNEYIYITLTSSVNIHLFSFLCSSQSESCNFLVFSCLFYSPILFLNCSLILPWKAKFPFSLLLRKSVVQEDANSFQRVFPFCSIFVLPCMNKLSYSQIKARKDLSNCFSLGDKKSH